jgi:hypothetical protein
MKTKTWENKKTIEVSMRTNSGIVTRIKLDENETLSRRQYENAVKRLAGAPGDGLRPTSGEDHYTVIDRRTGREWAIL